MLNPVLVREIRALYQRGVRGRGQRALGKQFNVHNSTIEAIVNNKTWRHVEP